MDQLPIKILYQDAHTIVAQTQAGHFDKFASDDIYGQFNMGLHVNDDNKKVLINRAKLLQFLNDTIAQSQNRHQCIKSVHWLNQIHSNIAVDADKLHLSASSADALISTKAGVGLSIMTADCVPIALFGQDGIACIHAGHQGLSSGVIANTVKELGAKNPLQAVIGACISQQNYEVSCQLAIQITRKVCDDSLVALTFDELYQQIVKPSITADKCLLDVAKLARLQLAQFNIKVLNDDVPCSYANANLYSYRAQTHANKMATGRMAMVVARF